MFGCLGALGVGTDTGKRICDRLASNDWVPVVSGLFSAGMIMMLPAHYLGDYHLSVGWTVDGVAILALLVWATRQHHSRAGRALNAGPVVHYGTISYSVYLWQSCFLHHDGRFVHLFPWNLMLIVVSAELSYWLVELPSRRARMWFERSR